MATGACGINCSICRLNLLGICGSCGPGGSEQGASKRAEMERIFATSCPILACAMERNVEYCLRDCEEFPCRQFKEGLYPFSEGYLAMQERRRKEPPRSRSPLGELLEVPEQYWAELSGQDLQKICERALASQSSQGELLVPFLNTFILMDLKKHAISLQLGEGWRPLSHPLVELLVLVYLLRVKDAPITQRLIGVSELKTSHFFTGPHELKLRPIMERFGNDLEGFKRAAERLGGEGVDFADAAYSFKLFPRIPIYYLLWLGDEEFKPNASVLFDQSIEQHFPADAIWGSVNLISDLLLMGKGIEALWGG